MRRFSALILLLAVASLTIAQAKVDPKLLPGKWVGALQMDMKKVLEKMKPADRKKAEDAIKAARVTLNFKSNGTYTASFSGIGQSDQTSGVWTLKGNEITATDTARAGKPIPKSPNNTQKLTITKLDKKVLVMKAMLGQMAAIINMKRS